MPSGSGTRDNGDLRAAATAVYAAADVLYRVRSYDIQSGQGVRGGTFVAIDRGANVTITLRDVKWTNDLATSGTVNYDAGNDRVEAALLFGNSSVEYAIWDARTATSLAHIAGTVHGKWLDATMPAP